MAQNEETTSHEVGNSATTRVHVTFNVNDEEAQNWFGILTDKLMWRNRAEKQTSNPSSAHSPRLTDTVFISSLSDADPLTPGGARPQALSGIEGQEASVPSAREKLSELEVIKHQMLTEQRESEILSRQTDANIERIREILGKD